MEMLPPGVLVFHLKYESSGFYFMDCMGNVNRHTTSLSFETERGYIAVTYYWLVSRRQLSAIGCV